MADQRRLVFPVGQFGGTVHDVGTTGPRFRIRRGPAAVLLDADEGRAWLDAHGQPRTAGHPALLDAGLIVEVDPDGPGAVDFARAHRLLPRLHGLGNRPDTPHVFMAGYEPDGVATLNWRLWRLWRQSHLEPSLWDGCRRLAEVEASAGRGLDPRALLTDALDALHRMLGLNLAYLDTARPTGEATDG